jgi:two-component system OmpR family response regulator
MRVLLIDDEKELVATLSERLDLRGVENDWVTSGDAGLKLISEKPYDCVVVDLKMPGLSGFDSIKAIKKMRPQTHVILLTGHSAAEDLDHALELGADHYMVKPVEFDDLLSLMQKDPA